MRATNKGDLTVSASGARFFSALTDPSDNSNNFSPDLIRRVETWAAERGGEITAYRISSGTQLTRVGAVTAGRPQFINSYFIDPASYPLTNDVFADYPAGVPLGELFTGDGNEVVISRNLADRESISVGDMVRVSGSDQDFVVRGIVPTAAQAGFFQLMSNEMLSVVFGFAYFDRDAVDGVLDLNLGPNRLGVLFPDGTPFDQIDGYRNELWPIVSNGRVTVSGIRTPSDILAASAMISDVLGRFIVVLGLGAMLLGGVGIINTMLVLVRRRTEEIAALKTFGLKGRQVAMMFLAEALWIGVFGSLVGGVFGVALSGVANRFGSDLIQQPLLFKVYPEAILFGGVLGVFVSAVFGILPVLSAAKVRPAIVLRPNDVSNVTAGCLPRLTAIGFIVIALGLIAGQIIGFPLAGVIGVAVTLLILGVLACIMWVIVWLVGKLPAFGSVDLRLALRDLTTRRMRTAITLLALSAGMFALSSIAFFGESVRDILQFSFTNTLGGNVLMFPVLPQELARPIIDARLDTLEGVESRSRLMSFTGTLRNLQRADGSPPPPLNSLTVNIAVRDTDDPNWSIPGISAGRSLTEADRGALVAVYAKPQFTPESDMPPYQLGDRLTISQLGGGQTLTIEIVGIADSSPTGGLGGLWLPPDLIAPRYADFTFNLAKITPEKLNDALLGLSTLPLVLTFDISFFDSILTRLITQFSALPILVGLLSLGAAAVITANTVALATLERRRQTGVMRAIGLKGGRVLRILLLENVIVSLLGALLGIGLSALGVWLMTTFSFDNAFFIPRSAVPIAVILVGVAIGIGAFATYASGSVAVRERIMNTLRYE
ncbi:MAG: ABC transporter permease [Chloroflexi bacterium OLB13]|nr:MAG: ABC transporter permease [Chloroflexi bacterium OLB13]